MVRLHVYVRVPALELTPNVVIVENGVKLRLNIVDTPGYGDQVNNENWYVTFARCGASYTPCLCPAPSWDPIIKYIKDQHSAYLRKELTAMRDRYIQDTRIHCCLFFLNPTGHSLRPIDVIVMKKLSDVVNVVPVIAKSDSLTMEEKAAFKSKVRVPNSKSSAFLIHVRSGKSSCTTISGCTPLTRTRTRRRRSP